MTAQPEKPSPASTPRSPMANGDLKQKNRFDALQMILTKSPHMPMHKALDGAHWIITGDLPIDEEDES